jgi:hypothetical protein
MLELLAASQSYLVAEGGAFRAVRCIATFFL